MPNFVLLNAPGPQGPAGPQGPKGDIGPQGPAGSALAVSGTGFVHWSGTGADAFARAVNLASNGANGDVTGLLPVANIAPAVANTKVLATRAGVATWDNVAASDILPGTDGQVFITSGTAAVWTSLVNVETVHGRFTAGGVIPSEYKVVIGPMAGGEASYGTIYFLPAATAPTSTNYGLAGDGTNFFNNAPSGAVYFNTPSIIMRDSGAVTALTWSLNSAGATSATIAAGVTGFTLSQATSTTGAGAPLSIKAQDTSFLNANGGNLNLYAGAGNGTGTSGTIHIGDDKITNVTVGWNATGTTNIQGGILYLQSSGGGGSTYNYTVGFSFISSSGYQTSWNTNQGLWLYDERSSSPGWTLNALTVTSGDVAPKNWTLTTQAPYASAITHLTAGDFVVNVPASVGAGVKYGGFTVEYNSTPMVRIGSYSNGANGGIWFLDAGTPTSGNFGFLGSQSFTYLNVPSGGTIYITVAGVSTNAGVTIPSANNVQMCSGTPSLGGGSGVVGIANATTVPTTNPSGGGVLYASGGALYWRSPNGNVTTIGLA